MAMSMPTSLPLLVLEVPRRVGAAGADDQLAAVEHRAQQAVARRLRVGLPRVDQAGARGGRRDQAAGDADASGTDRRPPAVPDILHDLPPVLSLEPASCRIVGRMQGRRAYRPSCRTRSRVRPTRQAW